MEVTGQAPIPKEVFRSTNPNGNQSVNQSPHSASPRESVVDPDAAGSVTKKKEPSKANGVDKHHGGMEEWAKEHRAKGYPIIYGDTPLASSLLDAFYDLAGAKTVRSHEKQIKDHLAAWGCW